MPCCLQYRNNELHSLRPWFFQLDTDKQTGRKIYRINRLATKNWPGGVSEAGKMAPVKILMSANLPADMPFLEKAKVSGILVHAHAHFKSAHEQGRACKRASTSCTTVMLRRVFAGVSSHMCRDVPGAATNRGSNVLL